MRLNEDEILWCEKYRPQTIEECILPEKTKQLFTEILESKKIPHLLLSGDAGVGKTTVAKALCEELNVSYLFINASSDNGVDMVRNDMVNFATSVSLSGGRKVIILDEADYLSQNAQPALRGVIDEFSKTCSVIMTCNYPERILEPLQSRCKKIDFSISNDDKPKCMMQLFKRLVDILNNENVEYDKQTLLRLIKKFYPDSRKIINEMDAYCRSGVLDEGILGVLESANFDDLLRAMKAKSYKDVLKWVTDNSDRMSAGVYFDIYEKFSQRVTPETKPEMVLLLAEWQQAHAHVASHELNVMGMLTQLMGSVEFN